MMRYDDEGFFGDPESIYGDNCYDDTEYECECSFCYCNQIAKGYPICFDCQNGVHQG